MRRSRGSVLVAVLLLGSLLLWISALVLRLGMLAAGRRGAAQSDLRARRAAEAAHAMVTSCLAGRWDGAPVSLAEELRRCRSGLEAVTVDGRSYTLDFTLEGDAPPFALSVSAREEE